MSKVVVSNNNKINLDVSVTQHHKHIQNIKDKKEEKENNTPVLFTQLGPKPTLGEREAL
jgi:hypothetical protein